MHTARLFSLFACVTLLIEALYILASYRAWRRAFAKRHPRKHKASPSHHKRPNVVVDYKTNAVPVLGKYRSTVKNLVEAAPRAPRVTMLKRHSVSFSPFEARAACKEAINAQRSSEVDEESDGSRHAHAMAALRRKSEELNRPSSTARDGGDAAQEPRAPRG